MSCLISSNVPTLEGGGGFSLNSLEEFGRSPKYKILTGRFRQNIPETLALEAGNHAHKFIEFIGKLHNKYIHIVNENSFIGLALNFFYEAEKQSVYTNEGFISTSICMESLFNEGQSDINYKLAQRASLLLGLCGINPVEANEYLKLLYKIRSKVVHGAATIPNDSNGHQFSEYARISIIAFLILLSNNKRTSIKKAERKNEVLKEIDHAMLNELGRKSLKIEIARGLKNFKLPIPRVFEQEIDTKNYRISPW